MHEDWLSLRAMIRSLSGGVLNLQSRRRRIRDSFRAELREIALELFEIRGFDRVTLRDIAFAAGLSPRTMPRYFRDKEAILLQGLFEGASQFRESLMTAPRSMAPVDAFQRAIATQGEVAVPVERMLAILFHCEHSAKLRATVAERRQLWQNEVACAIADWFGSTVDTDFRPDFWATSIPSALLFAVRAEAADGLNVAFFDPSRVIETAFENLRLMTMQTGYLINRVAAAPPDMPVQRLRHREISAALPGR